MYRQCIQPVCIPRMRGCKSSSFLPVGLIGKVWRIILSNYIVECDALRTNDHFQGALQLNQQSIPLVRGFQLNVKSLVRRDSPFFFWSTRHYLRSLAAWITSLNCICVVPSGNLAGLAKRCLSSTQCMKEISRFYLTLLTLNFPLAAVRLAYPEHADWIPSASSSCRCLIPSGRDNMSWIRPLMTVESSIPHKTSTSLVVKNAGGKAAGGKVS